MAASLIAMGTPQDPPYPFPGPPFPMPPDAPLDPDEREPPPAPLPSTGYGAKGRVSEDEKGKRRTNSKLFKAGVGGRAKGSKKDTTETGSANVKPATTTAK